MFTFGFFTTSIPYLLLAISSLFYFITLQVDKELADKWFSPYGSTEVVSVHEVSSQLHNSIDFEQEAEVQASEALSYPLVLVETTPSLVHPQAHFSSQHFFTPFLPRPPND